MDNFLLHSWPWPSIYMSHWAVQWLVCALCVACWQRSLRFYIFSCWTRAWKPVSSSNWPVVPLLCLGVSLGLWTGDAAVFTWLMFSWCTICCKQLLGTIKVRSRNQPLRNIYRMYLSPLMFSKLTALFYIFQCLSYYAGSHLSVICCAITIFTYCTFHFPVCWFS